VNDLYFSKSGNSLRALLALEECGLSYTPHKLDLANDAHKTPELLALNPLGALPVLVHRPAGADAPLVLTQSAAIVLFCAETSGRFIPAETAARAEVQRWFMTAITDAQPLSQWLLYLTNNVPDLGEGAKTYLAGRFIGLMRTIDAHLAQTASSSAADGYLCGAFSIADIALFPVVNIRRPLLEAAGGFGPLLGWAERVAARPAVRKALAA
jgi:GST-like protein